MHILFFSHYFPPEGNAPASRTYENCRRWVNRGHRVTVITCAPNVPDGKVYPGYSNRLWQREQIDGIDVIRVWTYLAANKGSVRRIANYVSYMISAIFFCFLVRRPDVMIATSPQFFCGWAGLIASWLRRKPFILEIRDIWPESIVAVGAMNNPRLVRFLEWLEEKLYRYSRAIVTVGEGYRRRLNEKGVPERKISIVMNGVDVNLFTPREPDQALKSELGLNGKFVCSYIGTIGMACGLQVVLEAAALLQQRNREDIAFMLVGDGAVREQLEAEAGNRGLNNVFFTGRQDKKRIPGFFSITDVCLVHLKKTDLFTTVMPSKIFEAAGMGLPMIVGVQGFASELVEQAQAGILMEPENAGELVGALERLAGDRDSCRRLGQSGHNYITQRFNRDALADDYIEIIQRSVSGKTEPRKETPAPEMADR